MESNSNNGNGLLGRLFHIKQLNTSVRTEVLAGFTTFLAMCYIIIVNPSILAMTGMDQGAVFVATCLAAALGCMVMGLVANYPIALAPGMGLNTYFTFSVCMGMGVPWQTALAAVFVSGVVFLFVSLFKFREAMINAIPMSLKLAIAGGIGLFLALIALKSSGVVIANEPTLIKMGDLSSASVLFAALGFLLIVVMHHFKVRGAIIISILAITVLSTLTGHNEFKGVFGEIPSLADIGLSGPFYRHFALDPVPLKIIRNEAPSILNWLDALQTTQLKNTEHGYIEELPADLNPLLEEIGKVYLPYLCKNVDAVRSGKKYFEFKSGELNIRKARFSQYRVWCLKEMRDRFHSLAKEDQGSVEKMLRKFDCWEPLWTHKKLPLESKQEEKLPFWADRKMIGVNE